MHLLARYEAPGDVFSALVPPVSPRFRGHGREGSKGQVGLGTRAQLRAAVLPGSTPAPALPPDAV